VKTPDDLRARITADLRPVRPLLTPWQRALLIAPAAALAWAAAPGVLGLRGDLDTVGPWLAWGGSILQLGVALALIAAALREAVPAGAWPRSTTRALLAAGVLCTVAFALATSAASPPEPGAHQDTLRAWWGCWEGAVLAGAPLVLLLIVLIARGLPMRPGLAGGLAGLGAGAAVDGGWRLYCNYSSPIHVVSSHGGAVLALAVAGAIAGVTVGRLRQIFRQEDR